MYMILKIKVNATRPNATFFLPNTLGAEIHKAVIPYDNEPVFKKHFPNSFRETGLLDFLHEKNIKELVICGMMTHMCIDTTTRAAYDLGFTCFLANDACATKELNFGGITVKAEDVQIAYLAGLNGLFANVLSTNDLLSEL